MPNERNSRPPAVSFAGGDRGSHPRLSTEVGEGRTNPGKDRELARIVRTSRPGKSAAHGWAKGGCRLLLRFSK
jgi:hypothetical protein